MKSSNELRKIILTTLGLPEDSNVEEAIKNYLLKLKNEFVLKQGCPTREENSLLNIVSAIYGYNGAYLKQIPENEVEPEDILASKTVSAAFSDIESFYNFDLLEIVIDAQEEDPYLIDLISYICALCEKMEELVSSYNVDKIKKLSKAEISSCLKMYYNIDIPPESCIQTKKFLSEKGIDPGQFLELRNIHGLVDLLTYEKMSIVSEHLTAKLDGETEIIEDDNDEDELINVK